MKFSSIKSPDIDLTIKNPKEIIGDVKQWRLNRKLKDELKSKKAILPLVYFENEEIFLYFDAFIRLCSAFVATNKALDSQPNNGGIKKALQDKNQQLLYCFQNHVISYNIKNKFHIYKFEKQNYNIICSNSNDIYTKNQFEENKLKNIESLANDYDNLEYFKQSLANYFESNFIKYAQSNNYYDKFRYYRIFTNKEIFDIFIVTFMDLALVGISAAIPGITPAAVTGRFIFASLSGGSKVASPLLQRAYFTFRSEKFDGLIFEIPSEFIDIYDNNTNKILRELERKYNKNIENLIEQNKIISQNRVRTEKKKFNQITLNLKKQILIILMKNIKI
ncbi:hypothetical protein [Silvanigrella sp.]|uniref:hypothetical protein n=1 Tax=Silvanigrella sp. TaxID=2024976 RepID=UPI0037C61191